MANILIFALLCLPATIYLYIRNMFTTGRIIFALVFLLGFVILMIWSYRKDQKVNRVHFKNPYKILLALLAFMLLMFLLVKLKRFL